MREDLETPADFCFRAFQITEAHYSSILEDVKASLPVQKDGSLMVKLRGFQMMTIRVKLAV